MIGNGQRSVANRVGNWIADGREIVDVAPIVQTVSARALRATFENVSRNNSISSIYPNFNTVMCISAEPYWFYTNLK